MPCVARSLGIRVIIGYKLVKAPIVLGLALWSSVAPHSAVHVAERIVHEIAEGGATLARFAYCTRGYLTAGFAIDAAILAWVDGVSTAVEGGLLLLNGSVWGEWVVVAALAALVPVEALSLERHPSVIRWGVLTINALIVAYLGSRRLTKNQHAS